MDLLGLLRVSLPRPTWATVPLPHVSSARLTSQAHQPSSPLAETAVWRDGHVRWPCEMATRAGLSGVGGVTAQADLQFPPLPTPCASRRAGNHRRCSNPSSCPVERTRAPARALRKSCAEQLVAVRRGGSSASIRGSGAFGRAVTRTRADTLKRRGGGEGGARLVEEEARAGC